MHTLELQGIDLTRAVVEGDGDAVALLREALLRGSGTDPIEHALIAADGRWLPRVRTGAARRLAWTSPVGCEVQRAPCRRPSIRSPSRWRMPPAL